MKTLTELLSLMRRERVSELRMGDVHLVLHPSAFDMGAAPDDAPAPRRLSAAAQRAAEEKAAQDAAQAADDELFYSSEA